METPQKAPHLAKRILAVGELLQDGTVVLSIDSEKNEALFAPAKIFGGNSEFDHKYDVVALANIEKLCGHKDWRKITDAEGETLSKVWDKVAPPDMRGRAAPWFWVASSWGDTVARVRRGGEEDWTSRNRYLLLPVPVVRTGPACV